ncbi:MAG: hypothetical protein KC619_15770 [Myxococcales bacterium]|nr:hypothetical protein [Myxococcales bacterium]
MGRRACFAFLSFVLMSGCAWYGDAHVALYGPYGSLDDSALVERVAQRLRERGYVVEEQTSDGRVVVLSRYHDNRRRQGRFVFQCYRGGWVQLRVEGPLVNERHDRYDTVHNGLRDEYVALATGFSLDEPRR